MNRLTKGQREKTRHFIGVADCSEKHAIEALRASDWNLQAAFEYYFNNAYLRNRKSVDTSKIEAVFLMYKGIRTACCVSCSVRLAWRV